MARQETVLQIFLASPSDLVAERSAVVGVVEELNSLWAQPLRVRLEVIRWETHSYPSFADDAQAVLNSQLPQDYDIFVGLMWARFGTPTERAGSGTAEEFESALQRFRNDPENVHLMMYFKDAAKPLSEIDPDQLRQVNDFRKRVEAEGGLHGTFNTIDDFSANFRVHLTRIVQTRTQSHSMGAGTDSRPMSDAVERGTAKLDDVGFVELLDSATQGLQALTEIQQLMTSNLSELQASTEKRTLEIDAANRVESGITPSSLKRITNHLADDMEQFARRNSVELAQFEVRLDEVLTSTATLASLALDFGEDSPVARSLPTIAENVESFGASIRSTVEPTRGFRQTIATTPRVTTVFGRAKKSAVATLDDTIRVFSAGADACFRIASGIRNLVPPKAPDPAAS